MAACALLAAGVAVPGVPALMPILLAWVAVALVGGGLVAGRGARAGRRPWWLLAVAAALAGTAAAPTGPRPLTFVMSLLTVLQLVTAGLAAPVLWRSRRGRRSGRAESPFGGAARRVTWWDLGVVLVGTTAVVWHIAVLAARSPLVAGTPVVVGPTAVDVAVLALLVWAGFSGAARSLAEGLVLHAATAITMARLLVVLDPGGVPRGGWVAALSAATAALAVLACLDPSRAPAERRGPGVADQSASGRVLLGLPFALLPAGVWLAGLRYPEPVLPAWLPPTAMTAVIVLTVLRSADLLTGVERQAHRDPLTDVLNRRGLLQQVAQRQAAGGSTLVAVVDVDDFKQVNDQLGHEAGDALLVAVAQRLCSATGEDGAVARLGGDEFVVLSTGAPGRAAAAGEQLADRLLDCFAAPVDLHGRPLQAQASIGVALLDPAAPPQDALVDADVAMYAAKRRGAGRLVHYQPSVREEVLGAVTLQQELRRLLGSDRPDGDADGAAGTAADRAVGPDGRLVVHYQPVVDVATGLPCSVEALVRWEHPRRGLLGPDAFVPLAESAGLGASLDAVVLRRALAQLAAWEAAGVRGVDRVGVNLGVGSLRSTALPRTVAEAARRAGVGLDRLVLEVTEHDALPVGSGAEQRLQRLREAGVQVALDDFGAGYSALATLRTYPVDVLKLDRSLLPQEDGSSTVPGTVEAHVLLRGAIGLAGAVGLSVVVEGVETERDLAVIGALGAGRGQGYLFSRPLPAHALADWWRARTAPGIPPQLAPSGG